MRRPIIGSLWLLHTSSERKKIGIKLMAERPAPKIMSFDKKRLIAVNMIMSFVRNRPMRTPHFKNKHCTGS